MFSRVLLIATLLSVPAGAQDWDWGGRLSDSVSEFSESKLKLSFEFRGMYEERTGNAFGKAVDIDTALLRTRLGLSYTPFRWLKFSAMGQDSRAPFYGSNAPSTVRDQADLHESYFELFPEKKTGFGMTAGRMMLNYGEGRLIGTPQWGNLSRTYDHTRVYYRAPGAQISFLFLSPAKIRIGEFNRPVLGDHVWGTYNSFPNLYKKNLVEAYFLRHDQNRPGGFTGGARKDGTDKLAVNTLGFRVAGPFAMGAKYSVEAVGQNGMVGPASHHANAWFSSLSKSFTIKKRTVDFSGEYKFASGTHNPLDAKRSGTFDQLYAANHDKFGHQDIFGWRNLHNVRSVATFNVSKQFALSAMYDSYWLAAVRDGIYSGSGKLIVRSTTGTAGRHVGQDADFFGTYKFGHFNFGAGMGHFFTGQFLNKATPGVGPNYFYVFHRYSL